MGSLKTRLLAIALVIVILLAGLYAFTTSRGRTVELKIFHAGSLAAPFEELEMRFEEEHPGVDVQLEAAGSVDTIRKVTELNRSCDVLASADYSLIDSMMMEEGYADWYVQFAGNEIVIAYTDQSFMHEEVNENNWFRVIQEDGVRFGFSSPNDDPCGYRAMMVSVLAEEYYDAPALFEDLISAHTAITVERDGNTSMVIVPDDSSLNPDDKVMIRPKETDLMSALEGGEIDYLFIYRSVATQHADSGVKFITLPDAINLSNTSYADSYGQVTVRKSNGDISRGKPIVYGVTIPKNTENYDLAVEFLKLLLGEEGQQIMEGKGQPPIVPGRASSLNPVPEEIRPLLKEE